MSAQGLNASSYSNYVVSGEKNFPVPLRDSSDYTRNIRETLIYRQYANKTNITPGTANQNFERPQVNPAGVNHIPGNSEWSWIPYGNQFRLSYFMGKLKYVSPSGTQACASPNGGVFNGNGPLSAS
jgi:hypothetical protein